MVSDEADRAKTRRAPKDQTGEGKIGSQTDEALTVINPRTATEDVARGNATTAAGRTVTLGTRVPHQETGGRSRGSKPEWSSCTGKLEHQPHQQAREQASRLHQSRAWRQPGWRWILARQGGKAHTHIDCAEPDPLADDSESDADDDDDDEALHAELSGAEGDDALDWAKLDDRLGQQGPEGGAHPPYFARFPRLLKDCSNCDRAVGYSQY